MKLLVIGHSVLDFVKQQDKEIIKAGGIFYTIATLNRILQQNDEIFLCSFYDESTNNYFKPEIDKINKYYLRKVDKIPRVHLNLFKDSERHEHYENITENLSIEFNNLDQFDGILINMITGFDINSNQLREIRKQYTGIIFIDIHTLSRGLNDNYKREFRIIPDVKHWIENVDIIQVNQQELFTLSDQKSEIKIVDELFNYGVKILCVTKGEYGAKIYFRKSNEIISYFVAAKKIYNPNVVGCGDVFGAAFFYNYIKRKYEAESLIIALKTAEQHVNNELIY